MLSTPQQNAKRIQLFDRSIVFVNQCDDTAELKRDFRFML